MTFWWRTEPPLWSLLLWPLEAGYRAGAALHRLGTRPSRAGVPVISVGNLTVGGSGKTPVAMHLAARLLAAGRKPAILSRGYGRQSRESMLVRADSSASEAGDEPLLFARRGFMTWVGKSRARLARRAVEQGADVLLLDDGLQHHALERDLDVIVADATNPLGNGALLPRGPLRERPEALRRVRRGLLWLTRCDLPRHPRTAELLSLGFPSVESAVEARAADLRGKRVFLFAAIARPERFVETVLVLGASVAGERWFRDHHLFTAAELTALRRDAAGVQLLTTEKDFVRLADAAGIAQLPIELKILRGEDALEKALREIL